MKKAILGTLIASFFLVTPLLACAVNVSAQTTVSDSYGQLPLSFEANQGQSNNRVKFLARGQGYGLFLTDTEAVLSLHASSREEPIAVGEAAGKLGGSRKRIRRPTVVRLRLTGANKHPELSGLDPQAGKINYLIRNDPNQWRRNVASYAKVKYSHVYPGIDLIYYGNQRELEYDFVVAPGANPGRIELAFGGVKKLSLDPGGNLLLATTDGNIVQHKPIVYQEIGDKRQPIEGRYVLRSKHRAGFEVAGYDATHPLIIDPVLVYSTYLGGNSTDVGYDIGAGNSGNGIAVDSVGNAYVVGQTMSSDFPTTAGVLQAADSGSIDVFVAKLNAAGTALVYSTYLGGSGNDYGRSIAVDSNGNAYVTGWTASTDFPTTAGSLRPVFGGGVIPYDAFVAKLNTDGSGLDYSTYLGGSGDDYGTGIAVDSSYNAYVTGFTTTTNFPTTSGAFQMSSGGGYYDSFVVKLNPTGNALLYSTYLGGSDDDYASAITVDHGGDAYVAGRSYSANYPTTPGAFQSSNGGGSNCFVTKLEPNGNALHYSTYLGGNNYGGCNAIALRDVPFGVSPKNSRHNDGSYCCASAYVTGDTGSTNFPTSPGAFQSTLYGGIYSDAFVAAFDNDGGLLYSTYLGGFNNDYGEGVAVDNNGNAFVTGYTYGSTFPTVSPITGAVIYGGFPNGFVTEVNPDGSALIASSYFGGFAWDFAYGIALDGSGDAYITGITWSTNFPTTDGAFQTAIAGYSNAFVTKIAPSSITTTTDVISSLNPSAAGQLVTFTATITGSSPTGTVQFKDGGAALGAPVTLSSGTADYTTSALTLGDHSITAEYSGDANNASSTSPVLTQRVIEQADLQITRISSTPDPQVGSNVVYTLTLTNAGPTSATGGVVTDQLPAGEVNSWSVTAPPGWTCTVSPTGLIQCTNSSSMAVDETATFTVAANVNCDLADGTTLTNTWAVSFSGTDPNPGNNASTVTATVSNPAAITPLDQIFGATGGSGTVGVSFARACPWTAASSAGFLTITSATNGSGNGVVNYTVAANTTGGLRSGTMTIAGFTFTVTQTAVGEEFLTVPGDGDNNSVNTNGTNDETTPVYATVTPPSSKSDRDAAALSNLYATAVVSLTQNGTTVTEFGVPASPPATDTRLFVDYRTNAPAKINDPAAGTISVNTGVAVVNLEAATANVVFTLRGPDGATLAVGHSTLPPANHRARFLDELSTIAPDFVMPANFATAVQFGSLEVKSDQPVSVLGLRLVVNQRGETLITTTPTASGQTAQPNQLSFPQVADGGGYRTSLLLMNSTLATATGTLEFRDNDGAPLAVHPLNGDPDATFRYSIPPNGVYVFETDGTPASVAVGSAEVVPDIFRPTPAAAGVFSFSPGAVMVTQSGVPATTPTGHALIYVDLANGHDTGLALLNPSNQPLAVTLQAFESDGVTKVGASTTVNLTANGHISAFIDQELTDLPAGFTGVVDLSAPAPVAALAMRSLLNTRGDFLLTLLPIADFNQPAPTPIVFPQIADGGGYQTQIVFINTSIIPAHVLANFFDDYGNPVNIVP